MLNEYKKPMWNDGYAKDMPWLNYFNEYERMHCCFDGDGENGESGGKGDNTISAREEEDKALGEVSAANAAAAAAAAAAASASTETTGVGVEGEPAAGYEGPGGQFGEISIGAGSPDPNELGGFDIGDKVKGIDEEGNITFGFESGYDPNAISSGVFAVTDPDTGLTSLKTEGGKEVTEDMLSEVGYNDLVTSGYFDALDRDVQANAQVKADQLNEQFKAEGLRATAVVDKDANFSYTGPDALQAGFGQIGSGIKDGLGATFDMMKGLAMASQLGPTGMMIGAFTGKGPGADAFDAVKSMAADFFGINKDNVTLEQVEEYSKMTKDDQRSRELGARSRDDMELGTALAGLAAPGERAARQAELTSYGDYEGRTGQDVLSTNLAGFGDYEGRTGQDVLSTNLAGFGDLDDRRGPDVLSTNIGTAPSNIGTAPSTGRPKGPEEYTMMARPVDQIMSSRTMKGGPPQRASIPSVPSLGGKRETEADRRAKNIKDAKEGTAARSKSVKNTAVSDFLSSIIDALTGPKDPQAALAAIGKRDREALDRVQRENRSMGGMVYRDGGGTASEDNKPFEFSMADYFKNQKTTPFYSATPNPYLVSLQKQIYPDLSTDEIYRRLGYRPAPDPDDTSSTTSYYNNPYGMNI